MLMTEQIAYTKEEVAKRLSISPRMALEYLRNGTIPKAYKVAGQWRIDAQDLEEYIAERKRTRK